MKVVGAYRVALAAAAFLALVPSAQSVGRGQSRVRTLVEARGPIEAFAQDGERIVWANSAESCPRRVQLKNLSTGKTLPLLGRKGPVCGGARSHRGRFQHRMALAGRRALWAHVSAGNRLFRVWTAAPGDRRERLLRTVALKGERGQLRSLPLAGDGRTLVYADITDVLEYGGEATGVYRVGRRAEHVEDTENTVAVAASGGRLALARLVEKGCVCNGSPAWSPDGEWVVFESARGEYNWRKSQIYVMRADGTDLRRVTSDPGGLFLWGSWSPDGSSILYQARNDIRMITLDGGGTRRLAAGFDPSWSPNGRSIVYSRHTRAGSLEIAVAAVTGGRTRSLALGRDPDWSPDGSMIAFVRTEYDAGRHGLYVRPLAGGSARRIRALSRRGLGMSEPTWSPDGSRIAFWTGPPFRESLRVVRSDGSGETQLAVRDGFGVSSDVSWSPDSSSIAFSGLRPSGGRREPWVAVVSVAGGKVRFVAPGSQPDWSPDGRNLVYVAHGPESDLGDLQIRREIARVDGAGSTIQVLTSTTPAPPRNVVEVRRTSDGHPVAAFDVHVLPRAVALSGSRLALLVGNGKRRAVELRNLEGSLAEAFAVPRPTGDEIFMAGRWLVFRTQNTLRAIDLKHRRRIVLAKARGTVVGLSIDGRRVAWAEQGSKRSRIRALVLPG